MAIWHHLAILNFNPVGYISDGHHDDSEADGDNNDDCSWDHDDKNDDSDDTIDDCNEERNL